MIVLLSALSHRKSSSSKSSKIPFGKFEPELLRHGFMARVGMAMKVGKQGLMGSKLPEQFLLDFTGATVRGDAQRRPFGAEADAEFVEKKRGLPIRVSLLASPDVAILAA